MHRNFFRVICQNPEYVKTHCNDMESSLNFASRNWMIKQKNCYGIIFPKTLSLNYTSEDLSNGIYYVIVIKKFFRLQIPCFRFLMVIV